MSTDLRSGRRGNIMMVGLTFGILLGFSALSVDIGLIRLADNQLQQALDSATFSGAQQFNGTQQGVDAALNRAVAIANFNRMVGVQLAVQPTDFELGRFDRLTNTWEDYVAGEDPAAVNAIRIDYTPPMVSSVLGAAAFGIAGYDVNARAMAVRPRGVATRSDCFLPFMVPSCLVEESMTNGANPKPLWFYMNPDPVDSVGYASFSANPNNNDIRSSLEGLCTHSGVEVGDPVYTSNGVQSNIFTYVADVLNGTANPAPPKPPEQWDVSKYGSIPLRLGYNQHLARPQGAANFNSNHPQGSAVTAARWGYTMQGPIAVASGGVSTTGNCRDIRFTPNGNFVVESIAWGILFDVRTGNNQMGRNYVLQLDTQNDHTVTGDVDEGNYNGNILAFGEAYQYTW